MTALITSHAWRPPHQGGQRRTPRDARPCEYMNCRRTRAEHARSVSRQVHR